MKVSFINTQNKFKISKELKGLIKKALEVSLEQFGHPAMVSVTFSDNRQIRQLNREYRQKDSATDVLSFPMLDWEDEISPLDFDPHTGLIELGDIVISLEKAMEQSELYGHSFERETAFLIIHSALHLLGYDHQTAEQERVMFDKQKQLISLLGL